MGLLLGGLLFGLVPYASADGDPCLGIDANGDGVVDSPPAPGSDCIVISMVIEPKKPQPVVDLGFHTVHAGMMWTPEFNPARLADPSLCFGNADDPSTRACGPVSGRCKIDQLNNDGQLDKICKWDTFSTGLNPGDTSACVNGWTTDVPKVYVEACAPLTTINGGDTPTFRIDDVSTAEGNGGTTPLQFTVSLTPAAQDPVSVSYYTSNETAVAPDDYQAATGSLQFAAGETSKSLTIDVVGDLILESDESLSVYLTAPSPGAAIGDVRGLGLILNDDSTATPVLSIGDATVTEGNGGSVLATFVVTLSPSSSGAASVSWATADGSAAAPADYQAASGSVSFAPGETSQSLSILVSGDSEVEAQEDFFVNLSDGSVPIGDGQGLGTIVDDDSPPSTTIAISDFTINEGNTGTKNAVFTVSLSAASSQPVTVAYQTADGTASAPADYASASGTVSFAPGETAKTFTVAVVGDTVKETSETFFVQLSNVVGATLADASGRCVIRDND